MGRFDGLRFPVHKIAEALDKALPELFRYPEFKKLRLLHQRDRIVKYIVLMYDSGSDLIEEYDDLQSRKEAAAHEAGFAKDKSGQWAEDVRDIMAIKNNDVTAAILRFLKIQKNNIWREIVITEQELDEFQSLRFQPLKGGDGDKEIMDAAKKKQELMNACQDRIKALESLYKQFYGDNDDIKNAEFDEMITPENALRVLQFNEDVLPN